MGTEDWDRKRLLENCEKLRITTVILHAAGQAFQVLRPACISLRSCYLVLRETVEWEDCNSRRPSRHKTPGLVPIFETGPAGRLLPDLPDFALFEQVVRGLGSVLIH